MSAETDLLAIFNGVQTLRADYPEIAVNIFSSSDGVAIKLGTEFVMKEFATLSAAAVFITARVSDPVGTKAILKGVRVTDLEAQIVALQAQIAALNA